MKVDTRYRRLHISIDTKRIDGNFNDAQKYLDNQIIRDTEPYVPFESGDLRTSARNGTKLGSGRIVYRRPYAHYLYRGLAMVGKESRSAWAKKDEPKVYSGKILNYRTEGTGNEWFEKSKKDNLQSWIKGVKERIKKR